MRVPVIVTFNPFAVPSPTWSMSTVISASLAKLESEMTAGVAAVAVVFSVLSIVNLVEMIVVPASLISTVKMLPLACAVERLALTAVTVIACGMRNVTFAVPVVSAVVSSEHATMRSTGPLEIAALTNAVVAMLVSLSPGEGVGAAGLPVNVGDANGANNVPTNVEMAVPVVLRVFPP